MTISASAYEAWVTALRLWRDDPRHDMSGLPTLVVDSLPPSAYERLLGHMIGAHQHVMDRWSETFARSWAAAGDEQQQVRALLDTRVLLARRLQLANHPGLPEVIRTELSKSVANDVHQLQKQLEEAATRHQAGVRTDRLQIERALRVLRTNRLTAILEPDFSLHALLEGRFDVPAPQPLPPLTAAHHFAPEPTARRRRAIIFDN